MAHIFMCTAALFTKVKELKEPRRPLTDEGMNAVCSYNGIPLKPEKEGDPVICYGPSLRALC